MGKLCSELSSKHIGFIVSNKYYLLVLLLKWVAYLCCMALLYGLSSALDLLMRDPPVFLIRMTWRLIFPPHC